MDTVINSVHIHTKKKDGNSRLIFANGSLQPFAMTWNEGGYKWEFEEKDMPEELKNNEREISNAIIMSERTRKI